MRGDKNNTLGACSISLFLLILMWGRCISGELGRFHYSGYVDQDYGLLAGTTSWMGFDSMDTTVEVWSDDGHNCETYTYCLICN